MDEGDAMAHRRLALAGLALVVAIGLTGCEPTEDQSAPAASSATTSAAPTAAATELAAAAAKLADDTARLDVSMTGLLSMTGVVDPQAQTARMTMDMGAVSDGTKAEVRKIGDDVWLKLKGPLGRLLNANDQWLHIEASELPAASSFNVLQGDDPAGTQAMVRAMTDVRRTGPRGFTGTVDLTKSPKYSPEMVRALGAKASAVPFTARTDEQGRLVELTTDLSAVVSGAGNVTTKFSDFGVAVDVIRPLPSETSELPSELRNVING
jgi:hypothetical protein